MTLPVGEKGKEAPGRLGCRSLCRGAEPNLAVRLLPGRATVVFLRDELRVTLKPPAGNAAKLTALDVFPEPEQISDPSVQRVYSVDQGYVGAAEAGGRRQIPPHFRWCCRRRDRRCKGAASAGRLLVTVTSDFNNQCLRQSSRQMFRHHHGHAVGCGAAGLVRGVARQDCRANADRSPSGPPRACLRRRHDPEPDALRVPRCFR